MADEGGATDTEVDGGVEGLGDDMKRDAIVDLWPFARPPSYYHEVLTMLAEGAKAEGAIVLSTTAHPGHWLACQALGTESFILTWRWWEHISMVVHTWH